MKTNNNNSRNWKQYFYTGVGHISHTGDVIRKSAKEFARSGNTTEADGHKIVNSAVGGLERKYNAAVHKLAGLTRTEVSHFQRALNRMEMQMVVKPKRVRVH